MTIIRTIKRTLGNVVARGIISDIQNNRSKFYYFLGKSIPTISNEVPAVDSHTFEAQTRNEITLMRRITASDICTVIPRINWIPNTVFEMYTGLESPEEIQYYCINSDFSVYKCLDNNNRALSSIEPVSISPDPFVLSDGYKWKFLYNIPLALRNKFVTGEYIPVIQSLNNGFFSDGGIETVNIINHGSGYTQDTTTFIVNGNGTGADIKPVIVNGQIVDVDIINPGSGYTFANIEVESTRTVTTPAVITVNLSLGDVNTPQALVEMLSPPGTIDSITINNGGVGYTIANVIVEGDGAGATATSTIVAGKITKITILNPGSGYTVANVRINGNGVGAILSANVSPPFGHGRNTIVELASNMIMFYQNLARQRIGAITIENDFSQYGIIRNPLNKNLGRNIVDRLKQNVYTVKCEFSVGSSTADFLVGAMVYIVKNSVNKQFKILEKFSGIAGTGLILEGDGIEVENTDTVFSVSDPTKSFMVVTSEQPLLIDSPVINCNYTVTGASDISLFPIDSDVVNQANNKQFRVISVNSVDKKLLLMPLDNGTIAQGDVINKKDSMITFTVTESIEPTVDRRTGDILFIENRPPINQTDDQSVTFRTVLKF
jgi:hypothetical protein